jgi:hypothetical protein
MNMMQSIAVFGDGCIADSENDNKNSYTRYRCKMDDGVGGGNEMTSSQAHCLAE